jgi:hypothetical protein
MKKKCQKKLQLEFFLPSIFVSLNSYEGRSDSSYMTLFFFPFTKGTILACLVRIRIPNPDGIR